MRRNAPLVLAFAASALLSTRASASTSAHLVYIRNPSAAACPDEPALRDAVQRRVGYDPFFPWAKTTVVVEVTKDGPAFLAHVQLVDESSRSLGVRDLRSHANGCAGLIDAAALAISIALEMNALGSAPPVATSDSESSPPPVDEPPSAPVTPQQAPPTVSPNPAAVDGGRAPPPAAPAFHGYAGFDLLSVIAEAPDVVAGIDLWVAARRGLASLGVEVQGNLPSDVSFPGGGRATIVLLEATLAPCLHAGPFFACALGTLGWLHASGADVPVPRSGSAVGIGAGPRAGVELALGDSLALRLHADLLVNALRPSVSLDGARWSPPLLSGVAGAGLAYRFP